MSVGKEYDIQKVHAAATADGSGSMDFPPSVERVLEWLYKYLTQNAGASEQLELREENVKALCDQMAGGNADRAKYMYTMFQAAIYEWNQKYVESDPNIVVLP